MSKSWRKLNIPTNPEPLVTNRKLNLQRGGEVAPVNSWRQLCNKYGNICLCCKRPTKTDFMTRDHIIPTSKGGRNDITNLQPLCAWCNSAKDNLIIDFRPDYSSLVVSILPDRIKSAIKKVDNADKPVKKLKSKEERMQQQLEEVTTALTKRNKEIISIKEDLDNRMKQLLKLEEAYHEKNEELAKVNRRLSFTLYKLRKIPRLVRLLFK